MLLLTCSECALLGQDKGIKVAVQGFGQERCKERGRQKRGVSSNMLVGGSEQRGCARAQKASQWYRG